MLESKLISVKLRLMNKIEKALVAHCLIHTIFKIIVKSPSSKIFS